MEYSHNTQSWQKINWIKGSGRPTIIAVEPWDHGFDWESGYKHTINSIVEHYPAPYYLCLTGGIDSQSMLYAWHQTLGVNPDVIPVSFMYNENCNDYDQAGIAEICQSYGYNRQIRRFDLMEFIDSGECRQYQIDNYTVSPQMAAWIKMSQSFMSGTVIMSGELTYYNIYSTMIGNHLGVTEYAQKLNQSDTGLCYIPFFFEHDQIIATAHWDILKNVKYPKVPQDGIEYLERMKLGYLNNKVVKYQTVGYPVVPQTQGPVGRCSGFEKFKDLYEKTHKFDPEARFSGNKFLSGESSKRMFDVNLRFGVMDHIKYHNTVKTQTV